MKSFVKAAGSHSDMIANAIPIIAVVGFVALFCKYAADIHWGHIL